MIPINSGDTLVNFAEIKTEVDKKWLLALKLYAKVQNDSEVKTRREWFKLLEEVKNKI